MSVSLLEQLREDRSAAADQAFADHDFGSGIVTDSDSWTIDGVYWSRWVYGDAEDGTRFRCSFGLEFLPGTSEVVETWVQS